jgi:ABC-type glycerol-3-phosphate transport system permease component
MSLKTKVTKIPIHIILIIFSIFSIFPFYYVIITAFKTKNEIYENVFGPPAHWTFENVIRLYTEYGFFRSTINSVVVTTLSIIFTLIVSILAAYAYSRMKFKGKRFLLSLTIALTGVPIMIVIIPIYVLMSKVNLLDNYFGVGIIYASFMLPFSIFLLTSFFRTIPEDLLNAARIDGCNRFQLLYRMMIPLSKPVLVTLIVVNSLWVWNDLLIALMFLRKDDMKTVTVALNLIGGRYANNPVLIQAGALFVAIPMIILFLAGQKYFIKGLLSGALKE